MSLLRRSGTPLLGLLFLQLTLQGTGTLRVMRDGAATHGSASAHTAHAVAQDGMNDGMKNPCRLPCPPEQCASMTTSCSSAVAPIVVTVDEGNAAWTTPPLPEPGLLESSPTAAPELPPPRA